MALPSLAAVVAALPLLAVAADAADPAAPVPRPEYRSVLPARAAAVAEEPELPWRQANDEVGRFPRGHVDLLKWEQGQRPPASAPLPNPAPVRPGER